MPTARDLFDHALEHQRAGRLADAEQGYRVVIGLTPQFAEAHNNLATILRARSDFDAAIANFRKAIELSPEFALALQNLAATLAHIGRLPEAIDCAERAIKTQRGYVEAYNTLCIALRRHGQTTEAIAAGRQATTLRPEFADAWNNLGLALADANQLPDATTAYRKAIELQPGFPEAMHNLATALASQSEYAEAIELFEQASNLLPNSPETFANLGLALSAVGRFDEAIAAYEKSETLHPDPRVASNRLYALAQHPKQGVGAQQQAQTQWANQYVAPLRRLRLRHINDRQVNRQLRVGYVSPDFHNHPVGRFMLPVLAHHDAKQVEISCYSDTSQPDELTEKLRFNAAIWRESSKLSDEQLAGQIRDDRIDILIDLTMHLRNNRLLCFAQKPAPVQVSYLAYPATTGLDAIDYRLTDSYLETEPPAAENICEFPVPLKCYWCYQPPENAPAVSQLPALSKGSITFGCLNNFSKVSADALNAWATILDRVPNSRLLLYAPIGEPRDRVRNRLGNRINFVSFSNFDAYLNSYAHVDIALDPFPVVGGTTTCDALWAGVPVVTLVGKTPITRSGNSILHNANCTQWIANSVAQYAEIAIGLARDTNALAATRRDLRDRLRKSPLMDAAAFTRDLEHKLRLMWITWCNSPAASPHCDV